MYGYDRSLQPVRAQCVNQSCSICLITCTPSTRSTSARRRAQAKLETPREKAARKERESKLTKEELNQERIAEAQKTNFGTKDEGGAGCVCAVQ